MQKTSNLIPYLRGKAVLQERLNPTVEEIDAWLFWGEITAFADRAGTTSLDYRNCVTIEEMKCVREHRPFTLTDYLCLLWFDESEIKAFEPKTRWLTFGLLVERWTAYGLSKEEIQGLISANPGCMLSLHGTLIETQAEYIHSAVFSSARIEQIERENGIAGAAFLRDVMHCEHAPLPVQESISDYEALAILRDRHGASAQELAMWIWSGDIQAFSSSANRDGTLPHIPNGFFLHYDEPDMAKLLYGLRFSRIEIESFNPGTDTDDDIQELDYALWARVDVQFHNPSARYFTFQQAVARMAPYCGEVEARGRLEKEARSEKLVAIHPCRGLLNAKLLDEGRYKLDDAVFAQRGVDAFINAVAGGAGVGEAAPGVEQGVVTVSIGESPYVATDSPNDGKLSAHEERRRAISRHLDVISAANSEFNRHAVTLEQRTEIKGAMLKMSGIFTESTFEKSWKLMSSTGELGLKNKERYARRH